MRGSLEIRDAETERRVHITWEDEDEREDLFALAWAKEQIELRQKQLREGHTGDPAIAVIWRQEETE